MMPASTIDCCVCQRSAQRATILHGWLSLSLSETLCTGLQVGGLVLNDFPLHFCSFLCLSAWADRMRRAEIALK